MPLTPGRRFGRLVVLPTPYRRVLRKTQHKDGSARYYYLYECSCDCGSIVWVRIDHLIRGHEPTVSCGCRNQERLHEHNYRHGLVKHPLYTKWAGMKNRCYNSNNKHFKNYGGRGITVCAEWLYDAAAFIAWGLANGWEPGLEIDRKKNNVEYSPDNCRFITKQENGRNRRVSRLFTIQGETKTLSEWTRDKRCSVSYKSVYERLQRGWDPELAFFSPSKQPSPEGLAAD